MVMSRAVPHPSGQAPERKKLGEMLVEEGIITAQQLAEGLRHQQEHGGFLGQSLVALRYVTHDTIRQFVVKQFNIPHLNLLDYSINKQALELVPEEVCLRLKLLPIDKLGRILTVAMIDPLDEAALDEVRGLCPNLRIKPILCDWDHFATVVERQFGKKPKKDAASFGIPHAAGGTAAPPPKAETPPAAAPAAPPEKITIRESERAASAELETYTETPPAEIPREEHAEKPIRIAPPQPAHDAAAMAPPMDPDALARSLATAMQAAFRESLIELKSALQPAPAEPAAPAAPADPAALLRPAFDAFQEQISASFSSLASEIREAVAEAVRVRENAAPPPEPREQNAPAVPSALDLDALRTAVAQAVRDGLAPLSETLRPPAANDPADQGATLQQALKQLTEDLENSVAGTISSAVNALSDPIRQLMAQEAERPQPPQIDVESWAQATREAVKAAVRDAMEPVGETLQKTSEALSGMRQELAPPDWDRLAHSLQEGVGTAVEEAMSAMLVQMKAALTQRDKSAEAEQEALSALAERLQHAVREAVASIAERSETRESALAEAMREALETVVRETRASREAQENRLAQLAEATLASLTDVKSDQTERQERLAQLAEAAGQSARQVAELLERHLMEEANRQDQVRRKKERLASVAPFGGPPGPSAEADQAWAEADEKMLAALESEQPLATLTFETFFPGAANAFTFKIAQAVAESPGGEYNPLFLYGSVGTGKTHLVCAIGNAILRQKGKKGSPPRVGYVSASRFARRLAEAAAENALDAFRENYCHWDVLILDDIQFLGGRVEAQEEFFHIFNALHQEQRQIIIVADKAPDRLGLLEQRLVSRFASGIVAELKAPEWETRMKILRHRTSELGVAVPEEVLGVIAMRVPGDVRKMTGALKKIAAFAKLIGQDLTVEMAQEMLNHLGAEAAA